jgi:hypothetical protein
MPSKPESAMFEELEIALSEPQSKKIVSGGSIQLKSHQMGKGARILVSRAKARKLKSAMRKGRGGRLKLSAEELAVNGEGLFDTLKKGWALLKKSGLARDALKLAGKTVLPAIATAYGGPMAGVKVKALADKYVDKGVDALGNVAGFGMDVRGPANRGSFRPRGQLANFSGFLSTANPAMSPPVAYVPDASMARYYPKGMTPGAVLNMDPMMRTGQGFRPAGHRSRGSGFKPAMR